MSEQRSLVRWRRPAVEGRSWRKGRLAKCQNYRQANVVEVVDDRTGGVMAILAQYVEVETRGPRGGQKWEPIGDFDHA